MGLVIKMQMTLNASILLCFLLLLFVRLSVSFSGDKITL